MPQQLIYTSAPRGVVAGRSGYCTVARSALLREALMLQLEKFCYYQHLSLSGGQERPIFASRIVDIRGARFHVLSRLQDAGLDFTGRTNFIAHHLVFAPEEIRQYPSPPVILRDWPGWLKSWSGDPQLFENETWDDLTALNSRPTIPAHTWQQVTGDATNGYGLLEARAGASFRVDDQNAATVLQLFAESLALLEIRDQRRDSRVAAWAHTFTTSMQEQDNPADFRWRCLHSDNPAAIRFATPDCRALSAVRAIKVTAEEAAFARTGPQPPQFVLHPQDCTITEGERARFIAQAEGVPQPEYQWFSVDRTERRQPLVGETQAELNLANPPLGKTRYVVRASNSTGDVQSAVAVLSVEARPRVVPASFSSKPPPATAPVPQKTPAEIERQRQKLAAETEREERQMRQRHKTLLIVLGVVVSGLVIAFVAGACVLGWFTLRMKPTPAPPISKASGIAATAPIPEAPASNQTVIAPVFTNAPVQAASNSLQQTLREDDSVPLAPPWSGRNIAWPDRPVATRYAPRYEAGTFRLTAEPELNPSDQTQDSFFFASRTWSTNLEFVARFPKVKSIGTGYCGLMLRDSEQPEAPFVFIGCSASSVLWMQRSESGSPSAPVSYQLPGQTVYLRLVHQDTNFSGDFSTDGSHWNPACVLSHINLTGSNYLVGFALYSYKKPVHADFDHVTINGLKQ